MTEFAKSLSKNTALIPKAIHLSSILSAPLRIIFAGTPDFAAQHLLALINSHHEVVAVYTQPDRPAGRGRKLSPSPVKTLALQHDIAVMQPESLKTQNSQAQLASYQADIMVVVAYGLLLPAAVLTTPTLGCINVHGSLLPRWRGAAPIQRALLHGDLTTGVSIMQMDEGLDTGAVLLIATIPITPEDTSASLYTKLDELGSNCLLDALAQIYTCTPASQDNEQASYAHKLVKAEGAIDWHHDAAMLSQQVRGLNPWPVAYTDFNEHRLRIWFAQSHTQPLAVEHTPAGTVLGYQKAGMVVACGHGQLLISQLQWPGGKVIVGAQLKNLQKKLPIGSVLKTHSASKPSSISTKAT